MAPSGRHHHNLGFHTLSHYKNYQNAIYQPPTTNPDHAFPILAMVLLIIMGTGIFLAGYYIFVNKCCHSNLLHQLSLASWFTVRQARPDEESFISLSSTIWDCGLNESLIREIPTYRYRRGKGEETRGNNNKCVVCLSEFHEEDTLRMLPKCGHSFHLDCIDVWLQGNPICPLCRTSVSGRNNKYPIDCVVIAPSSSPQGSQPYTDSLIGSDEDFVVIELGGDDQGIPVQPHTEHGPQNSREVQVQFTSQTTVQMKQKLGVESRRRHHVSIMGDECIDVREKDQFSIQPIRRSFSLDSASDRQLLNLL